MIAVSNQTDNSKVMDEQQKLQSDDVAERAQAAEALAQMGTDAAPAAVELVVACGDEPEVRDWAVAALEQMGSPPNECVDAIHKLISSHDALVAYWAVTLLGRAGSDACRHQDSLAAVLTNSMDASVQERAAWSLGKIDASSESAINALRRASDSTNDRISRVAKASLKHTST